MRLEEGVKATGPLILTLIVNTCCSALAEAGWDARDAAVIVGTSIGALTGALLRAGVAPADLYARVTGEPMSSAGRALLAGSAAWSTIACDLRRGRTPIGRPASLHLLGQLAGR